MFLDNHGDYEIICIARKSLHEQEKEVRFVIEANDISDAKKSTEKQLKSSGYKFYEIKSVKLIKSTRRVRNVVRTVDTESQSNNLQGKKILIAMGLLSFVCLVVIFILVGTGVIG